MSGKPQQLVYAFHGRFPAEKAHPLFVAKTCEAFAEAGMAVTLIVPRRIGRDHGDPYQYFGVANRFKIVYVPTIDLYWVPLLKTIAFWTSLLVYSLCTFVYLLVRHGTRTYVQSNATLPLLVASYRFPKTLYELHDFPERKSWFYRWLFRRVRRILVTNTWKLRSLQEAFPAAASKSFYEPNAVDVAQFDIDETKAKARERLGLPEGAKIVVYTGHLYRWKGVDTLAEAAQQLDEHFEVHFVGGTSHDRKRFASQHEACVNIKIHGHRPHEEMPFWQRAADVLVIPNTATDDIAKYYTSPMKLFEYMASHTPIVASRVPSIVDVAGDRSAYFAEPDNPSSFAEVIQYASSDPAKEDRTQAAFAIACKHTWTARAQRIIQCIA